MVTLLFLIISVQKFTTKNLTKNSTKYQETRNCLIQHIEFFVRYRYNIVYLGCLFKFQVKVDIEKSFVNAPLV
jgi:hypothetical protein